MKIKPLYDKIVIKPLKESEKTASGIYLPDTASKEKPQQGEVVAAGPGKMTNEGKYLTMSVKVGDTVLFSKYSPTEVEVDGEDYLIADEKDILAVLDLKKVKK